MSTVMTIENFDTPLRGSKIVQYTLKGCQDAPIYEMAAAGGEPFSRSILVAPARAVGAQQFFRTAWDAVFQIPATTATAAATANQDWSFVLTYLSNSPKPACIFIEEGIDPPEAFIKRLPSQTTLIIQKNIGVRISPLYDTVFFPPINEPISQEGNAVLATLDFLLGVRNDERRTWLKELRVAGAGLVWTRVGERSQQGVVYWYDPADTEVTVNKLPPSVVSSHLKVLANMLA